MNNNEKFVPVLSTPDDLMDSNLSQDLRIRILTLITGNTVIGIVDEESEDSFLVILPARLIEYNDNKREIAPYIPFPYIRVMKGSGCVAIVPGFGEFEKYYLEYLIDNSKKPGTIQFDSDEIKKWIKRLEHIRAIESGVKEEELEATQEQEEVPDMTDKVILPVSTKYKH